MKHRWIGFGVAVAGLSLLLPAQQRIVAGTLPVPALGANVDESRVTKILYVDPAHTEAADDDKHGVADQPFATFSYACQTAAKAKDINVGVKIVLAAGTYREEATIPAPANGKPDTDAPLVIEAAEREQAVIDGADTAGWSPSTWKLEDPHWTHPWPSGRHAPAHPTSGGESYRRGALVFVNGTLLRQVNAVADLGPGCFWEPLVAVTGGHRRTAAATANEALVAVVQPPPDTDLPEAIVQVGTRRHGLTIIDRRNVVVRGLLIQHAAERTGEGENTAGLVFEGCWNFLVEDVLSQWNDGSGLEILGRAGGTGSADGTLRRVRLLHNGGSGLHVANFKNLLAEDNETSFNDFRGDWAGWIDPQGPAGVKIENTRGSTWRRQHVVGNACRGFWLAGGAADATVEDAVVRDNFLTGVCIENNPGPVLLRRCLVVGTKKSPGGREDGALPVAGLTLASTPDVVLESNVFADNATAQLEVVEMAGKPALRAERHVYRHNVFYGADADTVLYRMPVSESETSPGFAAYYATLDSEENCFWNPVKLEGFSGAVHRAVNRKTGTVSPAGPWKLEDWQAVAQKEAGPATTGKIEMGSVWQDPLFNDPAEGDYRLKQASPLADWNLPSDEAATGQ